MKNLLLNPDPSEGSSGTTIEEGQSGAMNLFSTEGEQGDGAQGQQGTQGGDGQGSGDDTEGDGQGGDGQGQTPQGAAAPTGGNLTADDIAAAFVKATQQMGGGRQQQQEQPAMSQEEFEKTFRVFNPNDELLAGLTHEDPTARKAAYKQMGQMIVQSAVTIAAHFQKQALAQLEQRFNPALQMAQRSEYDSLKKSFYGEHKDLVGHDVLVDMAADKLRASGFSGTKEEAFKQVATMVRQVLKNLPQGAGAQGGGQQQQSTKQSATRMSTVSGGRSGAGNGAVQGGGKTNLAKSLFGPRK